MIEKCRIEKCIVYEKINQKPIVAFAAHRPHGLHRACHHLVQQEIQLQGLYATYIQRIARVDTFCRFMRLRFRVL